MIQGFGNKTAQDIWEHDHAKGFPIELLARAKALMTIMHSTNTLSDFKIKGQPPHIRLHKLKGERKNQWSIMIKLPWCITFEFKNSDFIEVKIENYHKG